jgi:plasmid maintenance system antidote protein VapI
MKIKRVNIGEVIMQKVKEKKISSAAFARLISIDRQNIKKLIFEKNSIDTNKLCEICEVLDFDFFQYYKIEEVCNKKNYNELKEIKATLSVEFGEKKQDRSFRFLFGDNDIKIIDNTIIDS